MRLYHGSDHIIERPRFGAGKVYNDYGRGFYCTESAEAAKEWAVAGDRSGFANVYDLNETGLSVLNLNAAGYTTLHWLTVLLQNRSFGVDSTLAEEAKAYLISRFSIDTEAYDVIRGYRADDSYFSFAQDFLNGTISYRQLKSAMRLGKLGEQVMIRSRNAFSGLAFKGYEIADCETYYLKRQQRDLKARRAYFDRVREGREKGDLFMIHILDEEVEPDDPRL